MIYLIHPVEEHILSATAMPNSTPSKVAPLRALPSVDQVLRSPQARKLRDSVGSQRITRLARTVTDTLRMELQNGGQDRDASKLTRESLLHEAVRRLEDACLTDSIPGA